MKRVTQVFKDLMTPDDQSQSWYNWATNQMSHAFLGAIVAVFSGGYWLIATMLLAITKEGFDLSKGVNAKALLDSLNDILFWLFGAGTVSSTDYRYYFAFGFFVLLSVGVYLRVKRK